MIGRFLLFLLLAAGVTGSSSDVIVAREDWMSGLTVPLGATIRVPRPADNAEWNVVYPRNILRSLDRAGRLQRPDTRGWRFEAIASGSGEATFIGFVPPDSSSGAAQPNPPRFVLKVTIR